MEADEARDLIEEAIERTEANDQADRVVERTFRDRVSLLVGLFGLCQSCVAGVTWHC